MGAFFASPPPCVPLPSLSLPAAPSRLRPPCAPGPPSPLPAGLGADLRVPGVPAPAAESLLCGLPDLTGSGGDGSGAPWREPLARDPAGKSRAALTGTSPPIAAEAPLTRPPALAFLSRSPGRAIAAVAAVAARQALAAVVARRAGKARVPRAQAGDLVVVQPSRSPGPGAAGRGAASWRWHAGPGRRGPLVVCGPGRTGVGTKNPGTCLGPHSRRGRLGPHPTAVSLSEAEWPRGEEEEGSLDLGTSKAPRRGKDRPDLPPPPAPAGAQSFPQSPPPAPSPRPTHAPPGARGSSLFGALANSDPPGDPSAVFPALLSSQAPPAPGVSLVLVRSLPALLCSSQTPRGNQLLGGQEPGPGSSREITRGVARRPAKVSGRKEGEV